MVRVLVVMLAVAALVSSALGLADAAPSRSADHNQKPPQSMLEACVNHGSLSPRCVSASVAAIEAARTKGGLKLRPLVLPRNYRSLTAAEQTFVVINLERVDRGIRPIRGMVASLDHAAKLPAEADVDPQPATSLLQGLGVHMYRTLFARDYGPLAADYEWMYDDGYSPRAGGTTNVFCPRAGAVGCWSHRASILDRFSGMPLLTGGMAAAPAAGGALSLAAILTGGHGNAPHFTYTWRRALAHGANGSRRN